MTVPTSDVVRVDDQLCPFNWARLKALLTGLDLLDDLPVHPHEGYRNILTAVSRERCRPIHRGCTRRGCLLGSMTTMLLGQLSTQQRHAIYLDHHDGVIHDRCSQPAAWVTVKLSDGGL